MTTLEEFKAVETQNRRAGSVSRPSNLEKDTIATLETLTEEIRELSQNYQNLRPLRRLLKQLTQFPQVLRCKLLNKPSPRSMRGNLTLKKETKMLSFHNSRDVKDKYINRVNQHMIADKIVRGIGWSNGKGCAVGCTLENYDHSQYPVELGIPEWLAHVEDTLFEGMSLEKSKTWPKVFLEAIPLGVSEETFERKVKAPFLVMVSRSALETFDHVAFPDVKAAVDGSIALWQRDDIGSKEFQEAAADAAAWAAREAGAAREAKFDYFADELLKLLMASEDAD